jgi:hypothetical protein
VQTGDVLFRKSIVFGCSADAAHHVVLAVADPWRRPACLPAAEAAFAKISVAWTARRWKFLTSNTSFVAAGETTIASQDFF